MTKPTFPSLIAAFLCGLLVRGEMAYAQQPLPPVRQAEETKPAANPHDYRGFGESPGRKIVVGLPNPHVDSHGNLVVQPNVSVRDADPQSAPSRARRLPQVQETVELPTVFPAAFDRFRQDSPEMLPPPGGEFIPPGDVMEGVIRPQFGADQEHYVGPAAPPMFGDLVEGEYWPDGRACEACCTWWDRIKGAIANSRCGDPGIGHERVTLAPFVIDITQPLNNYRLRLDLGWGIESPNRSEYYWAAPPKGPALPEPRLNYQTFRFLMEYGGPSFSLGTEVNIPTLDPLVNDNTSGFGDMTATVKTVMHNSENWQITQIFRTYIPTGTFTKGLGTGHLSLEPGMLFRYRMREALYFHSEVKLWVPIAADPNYSGEVLKTGFGLSGILFDSDTVAIMPTLELTWWSFLDGQKTVFGAVGNPFTVDGENALMIYPGVRTVIDNCDVGLFELGLSGGLGLDSVGVPDATLLLDMRFSY